MTNIIIVRNTHIMVEEVTQLMNVIAYTVFHKNYKWRKFFVNNATAIKKANESKTHLQIERNLSSLLALV